MLAALYVRSKGGNADMRDFMPHEQEPESVDSLDDMIKFLGAKAHGNS